MAPNKSSIFLLGSSCRRVLSRRALVAWSSQDAAVPIYPLWLHSVLLGGCTAIMLGEKQTPSTATICKSSCCLSSCIFVLIKEKSCFRAWEDPRMHFFCLLFREHFTHFSMRGEEKHCMRRRWKNGWGKHNPNTFVILCCFETSFLWHICLTEMKVWGGNTLLDNSIKAYCRTCTEALCFAYWSWSFLTSLLKK